MLSKSTILPSLSYLNLASQPVLSAFQREQDSHLKPFWLTLSIKNPSLHLGQEIPLLFTSILNSSLFFILSISTSISFFTLNKKLSFVLLPASISFWYSYHKAVISGVDKKLDTHFIKFCPFWVLLICCFLSLLTSIYPLVMSFSIISLLVAGVPMPPFSPFFSLSFSNKSFLILSFVTYFAILFKSFNKLVIV